MKKRLSKLERFAIKYGLTVKDSTDSYYDKYKKKPRRPVPRIRGTNDIFMLEASQDNPESVFVINKDYGFGYHTGSNVTEDEIRIFAKSIGLDVSYHRLAEVENASHRRKTDSKRKTK